MPRRPNELTPSDTGTPTDASPTAPPPRDTPPRLPRPPRLPARPAGPGRRSQVPSDLAMTSKIERLPRDPTPAPLPPSPGARDAEKWFDHAITDLGAPRPREVTGSHRRPRSHDPLATRPTTTWVEHPWVLPALIAAVALTIGMILGALLFGGRECPTCPTDSPPAQPKQ